MQTQQAQRFLYVVHWDDLTPPKAELIYKTIHRGDAITYGDVLVEKGYRTWITKSDMNQDYKAVSTFTPKDTLKTWKETPM